MHMFLHTINHLDKCYNCNNLFSFIFFFNCMHAWHEFCGDDVLQVVLENIKIARM